MNIRPFTSESYSEAERPGAWEGVLSAVGLRAHSTPQLYGHATALFRESAGVIVARLVAGSQTLSAVKRGVGLPVIMLPTEDGAVLKSGDAHHIVTAGHLLVLPAGADAQVSFQRDLRAVVLAVGTEAFHGRKAASPFASKARVVAPQGFAKILATSLEVASNVMEGLADVEWKTVGQNLAELALTLILRSEERIGEAGSAAQAALLHRVYQTIEHALDDPDLSPAVVARGEKISERYLQRLFEGTGDNFSHYVRERRLYRSSIDLGDSAEAHCSVSEIAFRYGFNDAAHFSRVFRERFGMSPRAYRQQEADRTGGVAKFRGQRGWPQDALVQLDSQPPPRPTAPSIPGADVGDVVGEERANPVSHYLAAKAEHVHWGYLSRSLKPIIEIGSGDTVIVETLTQHASDDPERMVEGDTGAESVFYWSSNRKGVNRRGAGPMDASIFGRGAGEGFGVHICTGPIAVREAQPGDVLEVRILDIAPRRSGNPKFKDRAFGSCVAAWWGYHYGELLTEPRPREDVTIYEIFTDEEPHARAVYSYRWEPQADPFGVIHKTYDYPGVPVTSGSVRHRHAVLDGVRIPLRPHFGVIALAPKEVELVDSIPPAYFGGNLDNWRAGKGSAVYLPVSVPGALLSIGDPHAAQGDGEVSGTAIECSMTGTFRVTLHKKNKLGGTPFADLTYPLIETPNEWILMGFSHPNYLAEFGAKGLSEVYSTSSLDLAMKDAFRKMRRFLMTMKGLSEDEAIALMSAAVDFGVTQVVDGNWGVHATIRKCVFSDCANV